MERKDQFDQWLPIVLAPLYREMNVEESEGLIFPYQKMDLNFCSFRIRSETVGERSLRRFETEGWFGQVQSPLDNVSTIRGGKANSSEAKNRGGGNTYDPFLETLRFSYFRL